MKRSNKKGFTTVELVIVIAVIAILAAVLIPTFANLVEKANQSADIQATRQMNTALAIYDAEGIGTIAEAKAKLVESNIDANNYKPLSKDHDFYWVPSLNRVILVDGENAVVYPEDLKGEAEKLISEWASLSGNGNKEEATKLENSAEKGENVVLSGTTNMMGASVNLKPAGESFTLGGTSEAPATLTNVVSDEGSQVASNTGEFADNTYYAGLISVVEAGKTVTVENLTIKDAVIGDTTNPESAQAGIIAGHVDGTLIIKNVVIEDCVVFGQYKIGALVGEVGNAGQVIIENVTIKNTTVKGIWTTAALIGKLNKGSTLKISNLTQENLKVVHSEFNGAVMDSSDIMTVNGDLFVPNGSNSTIGAPYLTTKDYWLDLGDDITDASYPGITFWHFEAKSGNYAPGN